MAWNAAMPEWCENYNEPDSAHDMRFLSNDGSLCATRLQPIFITCIHTLCTTRLQPKAYQSESLECTRNKERYTCISKANHCYYGMSVIMKQVQGRAMKEQNQPIEPAFAPPNIDCPT